MRFYLLAPLFLLVFFGISLWLVPYLFSGRLIRIRRLKPGDPKWGHKLKTPEGEGLVYEEIWLPAHHGVRLHCWLLRHADTPFNGQTILLFHGLHMSKRLFLPIATEFCKRGFQVFMPDLRAHGESEGAYCMYGTEEKHDVVHMIDWLQAHKGVDRVALVGISLGGIVGLQTAAIEPRIKAMVIQSPYTSLDNIVRITSRGVSPLLEKIYHTPLRTLVKQRIGLDFRQVDLIQAAQQLPIPVMFVAGSQDAEVPPAETEQVYQAAQGDHILWVVEGAHHGNIHRVAGAAYWDRITAFFLTHLAPEADLP